VDSYRLFHFRMYRAVLTSCIILEKGGEASIADLMEMLYRPQELQELEEVELTPEGRLRSYEAGLAPTPEVEPWRLEAKERYWRKGEDPVPALPPPRETLVFGSAEAGELLTEDELERAELSSEALEFEIILAERHVDPPLWLEAWLREYFVVEDGFVYLPFSRPWQPPRVRDPDAAPALPSHTEQEALLMNIQEEMRLRYGRVHLEALGPMFPGARRGWVKRFFDITSYGDVLEKSIARQTRDVIAVAARIYYESEGYTSMEAFFDFGCGRDWLQKYFKLDPASKKLSFAPERYSSWEPPPKDVEAPDPRVYAKLDAPRGYIRKGNGRYAKRKYGHFAGGILLK